MSVQHVPIRALATALSLMALAACAVDSPRSPLEPTVLSTDLGPGTSECTPGANQSDLGGGVVPNQTLVDRCNAKPGDLIDIRLDEVLPTQPSLGYDEVYYKLGRYAFGKDAINKRFDDWCEANGQVSAASALPNATLHDPSTFTCTVPLGQETQASKDLMKTVVIGPRGKLYLTDGHHTFTSFWETPDGGPTLHVRARVDGNLSNVSEAKFWGLMKENGWTWLYDANDKPITPQRLPRQLGLSQFGNDVYRGVLYFGRDIGYAQVAGNALFQEFRWGRWLRNKDNPAFNPANYDLNDLTSYLMLIKKVTQAQSALPDNYDVSGGKTALVLGKISPWNAGKAETSGEFGKLSKPYSDSKPGKLAYALLYKSLVPTVASRN